MSNRNESLPILVVDLDGTLIKSDMLLESFWSSFARDWRTPFFAASGLMRGRAALKARLANRWPPDVSTLPYSREVLDFIESWRDSGGKTALVTASDQRIADRIAQHLGIFDEAHGSDGETNLKGPAKAAFLVERFGENAFYYAGDTTADLPVWEAAADAVTVGLKPALKAKVDAMHPKATHLAPPKSSLPAIMKAMRPHQWLKNLLIFFPLLAAHILDTGSLIQAALAFVAFSLVASSVYLLNDLLDLDADRSHPRKCRRPLASGAMPLSQGMVIMPILLIAGVAIAIMLAPLFLLVLAVYYLLTLTYSLWLKRKPIIDICTLASLYTLRVAAGGAATDIPLSVWLLAFSAFLFFSLAAVKRQAELVDMANRGLEVVAGRGYRVGDLPIVAQMATASGFVAVLVMMLYLNEPSVMTRYHNPTLIWGACLILLYWIARMILISQRGKMEDDPVVFAARDRVSQIAFILIIGLFIGAGL